MKGITKALVRKEIRELRQVLRELETDLKGGNIDRVLRNAVETHAIATGVCGLATEWAYQKTDIAERKEHK